VFGIPIESVNAAQEALATAELLKTSLEELFGEMEPPLHFCISITTGQLSCGILDQKFHVYGPLLETGREAARATGASTANCLVLDTATKHHLAPQAEEQPPPETPVTENASPEQPTKTQLPPNRRELPKETPSEPVAQDKKPSVKLEPRRGKAKKLKSSSVKVSLRQAPTDETAPPNE
jgi:hypothetical protein